MESWISRIFLKAVACLLVFGAATGYAENSADNSADNSVESISSAPIIEPFVMREDLKEADIDTENFEVGIYIGQLSVEELTAITLVGTSLTFHATEDLFIEANYAVGTLEETSSASNVTNVNSFTDDKLVMYNLSLGFNLFPGEVFIGEDWAFNSALYVIGGAGVTQFNGKDEFTVNFGVGYRFIITDWLAYHIDFRDHIFSREVSQATKKSQNFDFHTGVTFFF